MDQWLGPVRDIPENIINQVYNIEGKRITQMFMNQQGNNLNVINYTVYYIDNYGYNNADTFLLMGVETGYIYKRFPLRQ